MRGLSRRGAPAASAPADFGQQPELCKSKDADDEDCSPGLERSNRTTAGRQRMRTILRAVLCSSTLSSQKYNPGCASAPADVRRSHWIDLAPAGNAESRSVLTRRPE